MNLSSIGNKITQSSNFFISTARENFNLQGVKKIANFAKTFFNEKILNNGSKLIRAVRANPKASIAVAIGALFISAIYFRKPKAVVVINTNTNSTPVVEEEGAKSATGDTTQSS